MTGVEFGVIEAGASAVSYGGSLLVTHLAESLRKDPPAILAWKEATAQVEKPHGRYTRTQKALGPIALGMVMFGSSFIPAWITNENNASQEAAVGTLYELEDAAGSTLYGIGTSPANEIRRTVIETGTNTAYKTSITVANNGNPSSNIPLKIFERNPSNFMPSDAESMYLAIDNVLAQASLSASGVTSNALGGVSSEHTAILVVTDDNLPVPSSKNPQDIAANLAQLESLARKDHVSIDIANAGNPNTVEGQELAGLARSTGGHSLAINGNPDRASRKLKEWLKPANPVVPSKPDGVVSGMSYLFKFINIASILGTAEAFRREADWHFIARDNKGEK